LYLASNKYIWLCDNLTLRNFLLFKMTVVQSIVSGVKLQAPANVDNLSPTVVSLLLEGIAQNTSGSVFEAQVSLHALLLLHSHVILNCCL
jgi:hypothetical protein